MLKKNFYPNGKKHSPAQKGRPLLKKLAQTAAQKASQHSHKKSDGADHGGGKENIHIRHKGHGDAHRQSVNAGGKGQKK